MPARKRKAKKTGSVKRIRGKVAKAAKKVRKGAKRARKIGEAVATAGELIQKGADVADSLAKRAKKGAGAGATRRKTSKK